MKPFSLPMFSSRGIQVLLHSAAWLLFFGLVIAASAINRSSTLDEIVSLPFLLFYAVYLTLFYLNEKVLLPRLYLRKKYLLYFSITAALLVGVVVLQPFDKVVRGQRETFELRHGHPPFEEPHHAPGERFDAGPMEGHHHNPSHLRVDIVSIVLSLTVWAVGMLLTLYKQWQQTEQRVAQAELEKANAELSFLKAQINPHFLFNTLNNIYALTVEKSDRAPSAVMRLSNIMRYVTDEARQDLVPLQDEVTCITDYISLQKLRLTDKTVLDFKTNGTFDYLQIAPLILMPFVENVFKYGVSNHQPSTITISIKAEGTTLQFFCQNTIIAAAQALERVGIGIENTKKRLQHLYPERHQLGLQKEPETFTVQLTLQL